MAFSAQNVDFNRLSFLPFRFKESSVRRPQIWVFYQKHIFIARCRPTARTLISQAAALMLPRFT